MKTTTVARGFIGAVASLLGVACGADSGWDEASAGNGEIGSVEQALTTTGSPTALSSGQEARFAAACRLKLGGNEFIAMFGGETAAAVPTNRIVLSASSLSGSWVTQSATLSSARSELQAFPADDDTCIVVAGKDGSSNGSAVVQAFDLELDNNNNPVIVASNDVTPSNLTDGRYSFGMSVCVDSQGAKHLVVAAGHSDSGLTGVDSVEVSPALNTASWGSWARATGLDVAAGTIGMAKDPATNRYILGGGSSDAFARTNKLDAITFSGDCSGIEIRHAFLDSNINTATNLSVAVDGLAIVPKANDVFAASTGRITGGLWADGDLLTVTNWTPAAGKFQVAVTQPNNSTSEAIVPTYRASVNPLRSSTYTSLIGGSNAAISASEVAAQYYTGSGFARDGGPTFATSNLTTAAYGAVTVYMPDADKFAVVSGHQLGTGLTTQVELYNP